jgi:hypothetical protein
MDLTQSGSHQGRPLKDEAEDVVLHTYLVIAELMQIYANEDKKERTEQLLKALEEQKEAKDQPKPTKPKDK